MTTWAWPAPPEVDLSSAKARTYWGPREATPERLAAWDEWKASYAIACAETYIGQGATREEALNTAGIVLLDLQKIDDLPWMPLGVAKMVEVGATLTSTSDEPLPGDDRLEFMIATRSCVTSTEAERIEVIAYQLGLTIQQAGKYAVNISRVLGVEKHNAGRTALYRHFDSDGMLLYIGIAKDPGKRSEQHGYHSRWWRFVADTTVEWFATRDRAEAAEREAINSERPVFNHTHNARNRRAMSDYLWSALDGVRA